MIRQKQKSKSSKTLLPVGQHVPLFYDARFICLGFSDALSCQPFTATTRRNGLEKCWKNTTKVQH